MNQELNNLNQNEFSSIKPQSPKKIKLVYIIIIAVIGIICITIGVLILINSDKKENINNETNNSGEENILSDDEKKLEIQYVEYDGKKIYLDVDFDELVYQFNGIDCDYSIPNVFIKEKIDKYDKKYFSDLKVPDYNIYNPLWMENKEFDIICGREHIATDTKFSIYFDKVDEESQNLKYKDRKISKITIYLYEESAKVYLNDTSINLSLFDYTTHAELIEKIGKYNSWKKSENSVEVELIYKTRDYNISLLTYADNLDEVINTKGLYIHAIEINYK